MQKRSGFDTMARIGYTARGLVYLIVGTFAALAASSGRRPVGTKGALEKLLAKPLGNWLVIALGAAIAATGIGIGIKGLRGDFEQRPELDAGTRRWLVPLGRYGHLARGAVFVMIGAFLAMAAVHFQSAGSDRPGRRAADAPATDLWMGPARHRRGRVPGLRHLRGRPGPLSARERADDACGCNAGHAVGSVRSVSKCAMAARRSGMPAPVRADVASTCGNAAGRSVSAASISAMRALSSAPFTWSALVSTI